MDAKGDAGGDPENSERDGRDTCQLYIDTFYVSENFMKKYKISKKKGWPRSPRPAPKSAFGSRWLLFFTFIFNFGKSALRHFVLACVSLVQRRREKLTYCCLVCSSVDERKNRRSKDLKMMQRRNKPVATPRGKGYNETKISRQEERPVVTRRKHYDETNERHDLKTLNLPHGDSRQ